MENVLVYGTLRKGHSNHRLLGCSELVGSYMVALPYVMKHLGGFPGLLPDGQRHGIFCEMYKVDDDTFNRLDVLEGYPSFYNRTEVRVGCMYAWIYYLEDEEYYQHYPEIESGNWDDAGSVYDTRYA